MKKSKMLTKRNTQALAFLTASCILLVSCLHWSDAFRSRTGSVLSVSASDRRDETDPSSAIDIPSGNGKIINPATTTTTLPTKTTDAATSAATTITTQKSPTGIQITITASPAKVRAGADASFAQIGAAEKGQAYPYLDSVTDPNGLVWYKIQFTPDTEGWIMSTLGKPDDPAAWEKMTSATASRSTTTASTTTTAAAAATSETGKDGKTSVTAKDSSTTTTPPSSATTTKAFDKNTPYVEITVSPANVRAGAGTSYKKIARLEKGQRYKYLDSVTDAAGKVWYKIELTAGTAGWMMSSLGKLSDPSVTTTVKTTATTTTAAKKADDASSPYYIIVYKGSQSTVVYGKDADNKYTKVVKTFTCSTGKSSSPTRTGTYHIRAKYRWRYLVGGVYGQYNSSISSSYLFHSVPYYRQDASTLENEEYDKLGTPASKGCIRMCVRDCKWIYDNCPIGTEVSIVNDSGPAGPGVPGRNTDSRYNGWDPSDKWASGNPYFA